MDVTVPSGEVVTTEVRVGIAVVFVILASVFLSGVVVVVVVSDEVGLIDFVIVSVFVTSPVGDTVVVIFVVPLGILDVTDSVFSGP